MVFLWIIIVALLASLSAAQMARRKRRPVGQWMTLVILFSPALLFLLILPKRVVAADQSASITSTCEACGGIVSTAASVCPHCGHPRIKTTKRQWYAAPLEAAGVLAVSVPLVAAGIGFAIGISGWERAQSGFPSCNSTLAQTEVNSAIANAPLGKVMGISVVDYEDISTRLESEDSEECHATVLLTNGNKTGMSFRFYTSGDRIMISAKLDNE